MIPTGWLVAAAAAEFPAAFSRAAAGIPTCPDLLPSPSNHSARIPVPVGPGAHDPPCLMRLDPHRRHLFPLPSSPQTPTSSWRCCLAMKAASVGFWTMGSDEVYGPLHQVSGLLHLRLGPGRPIWLALCLARPSSRLPSLPPLTEEFAEDFQLSRPSESDVAIACSIFSICARCISLYRISKAPSLRPSHCHEQSESRGESCGATRVPNKTSTMEHLVWRAACCSDRVHMSTRTSSISESSLSTCSTLPSSRCCCTPVPSKSERGTQQAPRS